MTDERRRTNINSLRHYLGAAFPQRTFVEFQPQKHGGFAFRIDDGTSRRVVVATDDFLDGTDDIKTLLDQWNLERAGRSLEPGMAVEIRTDGLHSEPVSKY